MEHGTFSRYTAGACRCAACTEANRVHTERWKVNAPIYKHGASAYANQGCRCEICSEAAKTRMREYHAQQPRDAEKYRDADRLYRQGLRATVFGHYGTACACCGTAARLTIDHVNGDGATHRRQIGRSHAVYRWLIDNGFPDGFQTLCFPCNASKKNGPQCRLKHEGLTSPIDSEV